MVRLPSYVQDTKDFLKKIFLLIESWTITEDINLVALDIEKMYPMMPGYLSEQGVREFLDSRPPPSESELQPSTESVLKVSKMCQENNYFGFKDKIYRQTSGSAIGQRQSPDVACLGAGVAERVFINTH